MAGAYCMHSRDESPYTFEGVLRFKLGLSPARCVQIYMVLYPESLIWAGTIGNSSIDFTMAGQWLRSKAISGIGRSALGGP